MSEKNFSLTNRDLLYPFAVIILMLSIFDLSANFANSTILASVILGLFEITSQDMVTLLNLILNLIAQTASIVTFIYLYTSDKIEPEEKKVPKGQFLIILLFIYSAEFVLTFVLIPVLDKILEPLGPSVSAYETIFPTVTLLDNPIYYLLFFGVLSIGAAISEELVFRRSLIPFLERRGLGTFWVLIFTSLLFAFIHVPADILQGSLRWTLVHFLGTFIGGFGMGYLYMMTRKVIWPILLHSINNSFAGFSIIAYARYEQLNDYLFLPIIAMWVLVSLAVGFGVLIYGFIMLITKRHQTQPFWMILLKDFNLEWNYAKKMVLFSSLVVLVKGVVPVIFEQIYQILDNSITMTRDILFFESVFEFFVLGIIVLTIVFFVYYKARPLEKPEWVSKIDFTEYEVHEEKSVPYSFSKTSQQFCGYCGKPVTLGAKFCMYCGKPYETEVLDKANGQNWNERT
ncbi:MAG: CPBP family glutamic-type intramembrane protease [Candidatus Hodarchaeales archaeon]